jgi:hypothetical protein
MRRTEALAPKTLPAGIFALAAAVTIYFPFVAWIAISRFGSDAIYATLAAAGICWFAASLALVVAASCRDPRHRIAGVLAGMVIRMVLPLAAGVVLNRAGGQLASHGVFGQIVAFYLLTLVIETWLSFTAIGLTSPAVASNSTARVAE